MVLVVDTSILIDHLRGVEGARRALQGAATSGELLTASVLTRVELLAGMRASEELATLNLLGTLTWVELDEALADRAGRLANRYLRSHPGVDAVDFVIAATVEQLDADLWTLNLKHFPMFPELSAPY